MGKCRINYLIKKYDKMYVPDERQSLSMNKLIKRDQRLIDKHSVCDDLFYDCDYLNLSESDWDFVHYLIDRFGYDFKKLHGRAKKEAIILAFIFYVKKIGDSRIKVDNYAVCKKYGLSNDVFILVVCRV